ncbi:MAG: dTMP kinase [Clostridia bacterium]|nr:dTMP kinase [Clostridia bacterium]
MQEGIFITVEGTDGAGKTTQIALMKDYLESKGYEVVLTREPGGTSISEKIRSLILDPENTEMGILTEALLYAAARAQLVSQVIRPAIEQGRIVICDRFVDSSYVYQGYGRGIDLKIVADINRAALNGVTPDITFFFDISPETALARRINATGADRIEKEKMDFHMKVYHGYKKLALLYPERIKTIDSRRSIEEISLDVREWLDELLG